MYNEQLAEQWLNSGIKPGKITLLHSNITRIVRMYYKKGIKLTPKDILESFLIALGNDGTLLVPLFNFDFTRRVPFNILTTPSQMGVLTEYARTLPSAVRTGHPIYSFLAVGHKSKEFESIDNFSGYGSDSPFAKLKELDGQIAVLGLPDQHSMTFYHYVEEMHEVSYRYHKLFTGDYINTQGDIQQKTYGLFVRDLDKGIQTNVNPMGELLWEQGVYSGNRPNEGGGLRCAMAKDIYNLTSDVIFSDKAESYLFSIKKDN